MRRMEAIGLGISFAFFQHSLFLYLPHGDTVHLMLTLVLDNLIQMWDVIYLSFTLISTLLENQSGSKLCPWCDPEERRLHRVPPTPTTTLSQPPSRVVTCGRTRRAVAPCMAPRVHEITPRYIYIYTSSTSWLISGAVPSIHGMWPWMASADSDLPWAALHSVTLSITIIITDFCHTLAVVTELQVTSLLS